LEILLGLIVRGWDLFELCVNSGFYCGLALLVTVLLADDVAMFFWLVLVRLGVVFA
jgi:hypothetical protein